MKSNLILGLSAIALIFAAGACKKKETTPSKQAGIVYCKVNGKSWQSAPASTVYIDKYKTSHTGVEAFIKGDTVLSLQANYVNGTDSSMVYMYFRLNNTKVGNYGGVTNAKYGCLYSDGIDIDHIFGAVFGFNIPWSVEITAYDKTNKKISGKFSLTMTPKTTGTTYTVTEGEFTDVVLK